jgi:glycosyltransferase involved in cell wall biosynthesis
MLEPWALAYKAYKKKLYYTLIERLNLEKAKTIQAISTIEAKNTNILGLSTPIIMIPNGINAYTFGSPTSSDIFYNVYPQLKDKILILFLARIDPKKGLDLLSSAFARVHEAFSKTHLLVAGPDLINFLPTVKNYFSQAGCLESVTFTGMLSGELKYAALSAASIYVAPSYSEGFSMSVLEAMGSRLPCVITTGCNFPEAKETTTALVVDINAKQIADALLWCLNNPNEAQEMGARARKFILENYTWDSIAKQLITTYTKILKSSSRQGA